VRCLISIVLNGLHHYQHNDWFEKIVEHFDTIVIVEGAAKSTGSTSWCRNMPDEYHKNYLSIDGTTEFLEHYSRTHCKVCHLKYGNHNKEEMFNHGVDKLKDILKGYGNAFLWTLDCDEQISSAALGAAEAYLIEHSGKTGAFLCNHYVGEGLLAKGEWGEGKLLPYRRLWVWQGEMFESHEPPILEGVNEPIVLIPQKFNHYAYYFEKDVKFKNDWYTGHDGIYEKWLKLQSLPKSSFPLHINNLVSGGWGRTDSEIVSIN